MSEVIENLVEILLMLAIQRGDRAITERGVGRVRGDLRARFMRPKIAVRRELLGGVCTSAAAGLSAIAAMGLRPSVTAGGRR